MSAGNRLKRLRTEAGLSISKLAAMSGTSQSFLSRVERGERLPGVARALDVVAALSDKLDRPVTVEEVFGPHSPPDSSQETRSA